MNGATCRLCGADGLEQVLFFPRAPRAIERLIEPHNFKDDMPVELRVYQCPTCKHVQLAEEMQDDYYEGYLMSHSHVPKMQEFQKRQAAAFLQHFDLGNGTRIFEAGCGDGQYSLLLKTLGCEVLANEASAKAREACKEKGLTTLAGYVGKGAFPALSGKFDALVTRQVLEHVPDPNDFMQGIRELLKPGGVALIEIPSLEQAIENDRFFDFFPDHLSYFSAESLYHLFSRNGFEVVRIFRTMDGEYNEAWIRCKRLPELAGLQAAADSVSGAFRDFLAKEAAAGRKTTVWGAGGKGVLTLAMIDVSAIAYLIDADKVKHHHYTPISHLQVSPPDRLLSQPVDTVIITALAYKDEIAEDLRTKYSFKGKIAYLSGGDIVVLQDDRQA